MEYIVFCDKANKAYELQRDGVCPACGEAWGDTVNHVVMTVSLGTERRTRCYMFRSFLRACKETRIRTGTLMGIIAM